MPAPSPLRIAAIMPVYHRPRLAIEALASVASQSRPPDKLIVVDDGSDDRTPEAVQAWMDAARPPFETRLIRQPHAGAGAARNRGAAEAKDCDLLAFLDSDDLWRADYLALTAQAMALHPDAAAVSCDRWNFDGRSGQTEYRDVSGIAEKPTEWIFLRGPAGLSNSMFRAEDFFAAGGFPEDMPTGQDEYLALKISTRGRWLHVPGAHVTYRRCYAETRGEHPSLSRLYPDRYLRYAHNRQRFLFEDGGSDVIEESAWKRKMNATWRLAGRHLLKLGRRAEAGECFRRAIRLRRRDWRSRWMLARTSVTIEHVHVRKLFHRFVGGG